MKKLIFLLLTFFVNIRSLDNQEELLAKASDDELTKIVFDYMLQPMNYVKMLMRHAWPISYVDYSPNEKYLVSGSVDGISIWDIAMGQCIKKQVRDTSYVCCVHYSPDGKYLASSYRDGIRIFDMATGLCINTLTWHTNTTSADCIKYSPDGKYLASGFLDGIRIYDMATGQCVKMLTGHAWNVSCVSYSPDGKYLASCSNNETIIIWDMATGQYVKTLTGHACNVSCVNYSPDGKYLASGSWDKAIRIWDMATGQCIDTLTGHTSHVSCVSYSPDGKYLASGSIDKTIRIWNMATGQCINTLTGHTSYVSCLSYSPDGKYLASGSIDKTIRIWDTKKINNELFLLLKNKRLSVFNKLKQLILDNYEYVDRNNFESFINQMSTNENTEILNLLKNKIKPTFSTYINNNLLPLLCDDQLKINTNLLNSGQSKKHLISNLEQALTIRRDHDVIFNKPEVKKYFLEIYKKEKEENNKNNYVFYHGRKKTFRFLEEIYRKLWCLKNNQEINDYMFLRFESKEKVEKIRYDCLFMNYALFANCREGSGAATVTRYWLNDENRHDPNYSIEKMFEMFSLKKLYKKYEKELLDLEGLHNNGSKYGDIVLVSIPKNKIGFVKIVAPGGHEREVFINGIKIEDTKIVLDALMTNPKIVKDIDNKPASDYLEFALPITNEYVLDPKKGPRIYSFYFLDEKKRKEYEKKRDELFQKIRKDYLEYKQKNIFGKMYTTIWSRL